ncbi:acyltransferase [Brachybacterium sp. DNPG3]
MSSPIPRYLPYLDVTRIVAVLGVVGVHVVGGGVAAHDVGITTVAVLMSLKAAVPVFFMMSGALNLDPLAQRDGPGAFLVRRAKRILPALVVWSAFYLLVIRGAVSGQPVASLGELIDLISTGETYTHLYFLFAIAGLYLITPVLTPFLAQDEGRRAWILGLAAAAWTVLAVSLSQAGGSGLLSVVPVAASSLTYFLLYTCYYVLGRAVIVAPIPRPAAVAGLVLSPALVVAITAIYLRSAGGIDGSAPVEPWAAVLAPLYGSLPVVVYAVVLMASISRLCGRWRVSERAERILRTLGAATFGIFLVHFAVLVVLRELIPALRDYDAVPMAITWAVTVAVSTCIALLGRRVPLVRTIF